MPRKILFIAFIASIGPALSAAHEPSANLLPVNRSIESVIDHYINAKHQQQKIKAAPLADDATVLRRLTLDLVGRIPTLAEGDSYFANSDADKKAALVDRLMASPEFVRHQADRFVAMLKGQGAANRRSRGSNALRDYLRRSLAEKHGWDRMFRELMLPDQSSANGRAASEFLKSRVRDLNKMTVDVSTIFFGVNISCAQCHEHPHVRQWKQDHFYGMKSFFARTFDNGGFLAERSYGDLKFTPNKGKQKVAKVMFLTGNAIATPSIDKKEQNKERQQLARLKKQKKPAPAPKFSLRSKLVDLALEPRGRKYFSRSIVNRVWHRYFGYGLVMPMDQMHEENPSSHPQLLEWLARDMADHEYDLRRLIRGIVMSAAYARSSRTMGGGAPLDKWFAQGKVRPLAPMQLARSLVLASTDPGSLPDDAKKLREYFERTLQSRAGGLAPLFPEPGDRFQVSVKEAMLFSNNEKVQRELLQNGNSLAARLAKTKDLKKRAQFAVRAVFSRPPQGNEIEVLSDYMRQRESQPEEACRQVVWALLTSSEFRFNH